MMVTFKEGYRGSYYNRYSQCLRVAENALQNGACESARQDRIYLCADTLVSINCKLELHLNEVHSVLVGKIDTFCMST